MDLGEKLVYMYNDIHDAGKPEQLTAKHGNT